MIDLRKVYNCQRCDAEMEITDPQEQNQVICRRCGRSYRLFFNETGKSWILQPEHTVEVDTDKRPEEIPFSVLGEVGRPKQVDRSEKHREQTDLSPDDEAIAGKPGRKD